MDFMFEWQELYLTSERSKETNQEYPTEPLDRKPARQASITLAGKY